VRFKAGNVEFRVSFLILIIPILMLAVGYLKEYAMAFFSVALHELGHVTVAGFYGTRPDGISITPVGLIAAIRDRGSSRMELLKIYIAGPAVNFLLFLIAILAVSVLSNCREELRQLAMVNLLLALFNLLPVFPLDGGRILHQLLSYRMGMLAAGKKVRMLALIISAAIMAVGVIQFYISVGNISLIMIGVYIPLILKDAGMESAIMNIQQLLYRRSRLMKKGIYPARDLVVTRNTKLGDTLTCMDFDRFHIIYVLDDNLRLVSVFTESEIMDALSGEIGNITFEQLMSKSTGGDIDI
jgi:stage IV sporulation protein FB